MPTTSPAGHRRVLVWALTAGAALIAVAGLILLLRAAALAWVAVVVASVRRCCGGCATCRHAASAPSRCRRLRGWRWCAADSPHRLGGRRRLLAEANRASSVLCPPSAEPGQQRWQFVEVLLPLLHHPQPLLVGTGAVCARSGHGASESLPSVSVERRSAFAPADSVSGSERSPGVV